MMYLRPVQEDTTFFHKKLITWYLNNFRKLPWRKTIDPYRIWLSEIILQQTRVAQGLPYYEKFVETYPTVHELASASQEEVLKLWQGLGYYSRARNLHATAQYVSNELGGVFPKNYKGLLQLKGVGDYTASAIASICYNEPTAVVDGNVYRVLSRVFGIDTPINSTEGTKIFKLLAQSLLDATQPGTYNQAIMEFGARYCVPQQPECGECIFAEQCDAYRSGRVSELPVKGKKNRVKKIYLDYFVVLSEDDRTLLEQRTQKGIWQQLYEFPSVRSAKKQSLAALKHSEAFQRLARDFDITALTEYADEPVIHKLSHQHLYTRFWIVNVDAIGSLGIALKELEAYPVPVLVARFISEFKPFQP
ncbi:A/G-specific adenine glycosylase [Altibacter sp. HG106]|uniref:A/G-specific adenine glycosylase n=1 Tax=Altibacter sp. HG106 TaxID=3023937 RepID=UPI002350623C|nr:A/G-specific adenine glycosylase [Altibacter sp. HG106]MDC7995207.1 A/G-specific adenine glycosylase [Altibacter sp. HG106]